MPRRARGFRKAALHQPSHAGDAQPGGEHHVAQPAAVLRLEARCKRAAERLVRLHGAQAARVVGEGSVGRTMGLHARCQCQCVLHGQRRTQAELRAHGVRGVADHAVGRFGERARPRVAIDGKGQVVMRTDLLDHRRGLRPQAQHLCLPVRDVGLAPGVHGIAGQTPEHRQARAVAVDVRRQQPHHLARAAKPLLQHARVPAVDPPLKPQRAPSVGA